MSYARRPFVPIFLEMGVRRLPRRRKKALMRAFRLLYAAVALHNWQEKSGRTHEHASRLFQRVARSVRFRCVTAGGSPGGGAA